MTVPTMDQFTARVKQAVKEQMTWAQAEFHLPSLPLGVKIVDVPTGPLGLASVVKSSPFQARVKFQAYHFVRDELKAFSEYATYNAWPEIGGFETKDWELATDTLVAHELAHVIQYALKYAGADHPLLIPHSDRYFDGLGKFEKAHSKFFRQIYRRFRNRFINHRVPASAYTAPRGDFIEGTHFEESMAAKTGDHPLTGIRFALKGKTYKVVGRNPRNAKLFGYMVETPTGSFAKIKLSLICAYSDEAKKIVMADSALRKELVDLDAAQQVKRVANAKSSMTKRIRAHSRKATVSRFAHYA